MFGQDFVGFGDRLGIVIRLNCLSHSLRPIVLAGGLRRRFARKQHHRQTEEERHLRERGHHEPRVILKNIFPYSHPNEDNAREA
jgi:hypothetical protein